jgi:hypothetical protein
VFALVSELNEHPSVCLSVGCSRKGGPSVHESPPEPLLGRIERVFLPSSTSDWRLPTPVKGWPTAPWGAGGSGGGVRFHLRDQRAATGVIVLVITSKGVCGGGEWRGRKVGCPRCTKLGRRRRWTARTLFRLSWDQSG